MGALTFKPIAFQFRPWELTLTEVFNYVEGAGQLTFHLRGTKVQKITSPGWLQDQTRFSYDGFRRQRLTTPLVEGTPVGWPTAMAVWYTILSRAVSFAFKVDPVTGAALWWWLRLYQGTRAFTVVDTAATLVAVDTVVVNPGVYHGAFGLAGAGTAEVALPLGLPYENNGFLTPPTGVPTECSFVLAQIFYHGGVHRGTSWPTPGENTPRTTTCALFQVSPLQRMLTLW